VFAFRPIFVPLLYLVIGVVVAAVYDYFSNLETAGRVLTVIAAVVMWPFLLFGFDINIQRNGN
jgi:ABC-type Na+ efflux pump permease subunit